MAADVLGKLRYWASDYARRMGRPSAADAFYKTLAGISWVESGLGQQPVGDSGQSRGLFHTHLGGRNLSGLGKRASTPEEMTAVYQNIDLDIQNSMPELWNHFVQHGAEGGFSRNPGDFVAQVALTGQRPNKAAWQSVASSGGYAKGVQVASSGRVPTSGSPLQAAAGLPSGAKGAAPSAQSRAVDRYAAQAAAPKGATRAPVSGPITSRFGTPFSADSGATFQGKTYPHFNKGVDYGVGGGTPVQANVSGVVKLAGDDGSGWGPRVVLVDGEGFEHSYGHLDAASVSKLRPGMKVPKGTVIGKVASGRVGTSTGAHLSYDVFRGGEPVDPSPWLGVDAVDPTLKATNPPRAQKPGAARTVTPTALPRTGVGQQAQGGTVVQQQQTPNYDTSLVELRRQQVINLKRIDDQIASAQERIKELQANAASDPNAQRTVRQLQVSIEQLQPQRTQLVTQIVNIDQELRQQQKAGTVDGQPTPGEVIELDQAQYDNAMERYDTLRQQGLDQYEAAKEAFGSKMDIREQQRTEAQDVYGADVDAFTAASDIMADVIGLNNDFSKMLLDTMEGNRDDMREAVRLAIDQRRLSLDEGQAYLDAQAAQQLDEAKRVAQVFAQAQWINETKFRNATRLAPPGMDYFPGLEPSSSLNNGLRALGMGELVVKLRKVDPSELDPITSLRQSEQITGELGYGRPDYSESIDWLKRRRDQAMPAYEAQPIDTDTLAGEIGYNFGEEYGARAEQYPGYSPPDYGEYPEVPDLQSNLTPEMEQVPAAPAPWRESVEAERKKRAAAAAVNQTGAGAVTTPENLIGPEAQTAPQKPAAITPRQTLGGNQAPPPGATPEEMIEWMKRLGWKAA